jgi:hypothetical protein
MYPEFSILASIQKNSEFFKEIRKYGNPGNPVEITNPEISSSKMKFL